MIYLDHHAAAPLTDGVREAMARVHAEAWANPSSVHAAGRAARAVVERARRTLAEAIRAEPADLVFTAGGTEACNLAVLGLGVEGARAGGRVITSPLEHPAILEAAEELARRGARVEQLAPGPLGMPAPDDLAARLADDVALVALSWVNHETGAVAPVAEYARVCAARGVPLVIDGSQALGKVACEIGALGASAVVFASTKIGGPGGAAALWIARDRALAPTSFGGAQERGRRAGTPDVAAIAGFGAAAQQASARLAAMPRVAVLRDRLEQTLCALGATANATEGPRVATVSNVSVPGWRGEVLVAALDVEGLCASSGAACSSGLGAPSPVLRALYPEAPWRAESALRLSLGPETRDDEVRDACATLRRVLARTSG